MIKIDSPENNNLVLIKHSYLYNYLDENKSKVEEKFKVKLLFLGVLRENGALNKRSLSYSLSQLSLNDAESSSDSDSEISNQSHQVANKRNNNRKLFKIAIRAELNKQFDQCKNYIGTLNENFRLKFITVDEKSKHFEYLISRKIKELKNEFDDIEMSYAKKPNQIIVFLTSANEKNRKKIDEILKQLEIVSKEIGFKPTLTDLLKTKRVELERSFNVKVDLNYNKKTVEVHCLKLDEDDFKKVFESIENIEKENREKTDTINDENIKITPNSYRELGPFSKDLIDLYKKPINKINPPKDPTENKQPPYSNLNRRPIIVGGKNLAMRL